MTTFVVTADLHIGAPMDSAGAAASEFRERKYDVISSISNIINENDVKVVFILGDLFDSDRIGEKDIQRTAVLLSKINCQVYIIPGNHDWWHRGGSLETFSRFCTNYPNITIILDNSPLELNQIPEAIFFPCPLLKKNPINDPTLWIPTSEDDSRLRIGLLHGAIDTAPGGNIPKNVSELRHLDYTFLGDWHNPVKINDITMYCGSPEPLGFDEKHKGSVLLIQLIEGNIDISPLYVGQLSWKRIEIEFQPSELGGLGIQPLIQELESIETPPNSTVIRFHLSGNLSHDELNEFDRIISDTTLYGWAYVDCNDIHVKPFNEIDFSIYPDSIKLIVEEIMTSDASDIVKRKALSILDSKMEVE